MNTELPRGVRNCNPGNIRKVPGVVWRGQSELQEDPDFVQFESPEYGIRALARILLEYQYNDGIETLDGVVARYAPASENDTRAYVLDVAKRCNVSPTETVRIDSLLPVLIPAIIAHECADYEYPEQTVNNGIALARGIQA